MKRCPSLVARIQRLPQRYARSTTSSHQWRRPLCVSSYDSRRQNSSNASTTSPFPANAVSSRGFASSSHTPTVRKEAAKKTPVSADDFEALKQFLMKPATEGDAANAAKAIVSSMMDHHVYADMSGQEAAVMSMVADAMQDYAFVVDVYNCLRRARVAPSPMTLELTAEACAATGDWQTAHDVIDQMREAVDIMHPSVEIYENAVRACHTAKKWMQGKQLLEAMRNDGLEASADIHLQVIETCLLSGELTATQRLLQEFLREFSMLEADEVRDVLEGLLGMAIEHDVLDHALFFRDQLAQRQVLVPKETYEELIRMSARQGKWHSARVLLAQLTKARALPVAAPSNQFTNDTERLLDEMHDHGLEISLDIYNKALRAYGGQIVLDKAENLLATMQQRGVRPDTVSYAAVINSCGMNVDASLQYFEEFEQTGLPMSPDLVHAFLLVPSRAKEWQIVVDRYEMIQKSLPREDPLLKQIDLDTRILSCVATAHGQMENNDKMLSVFTSMKVRGLVPNLYVYAEAMQAYIRKGQWRHALLLFDHMWTEEIDKEKLKQFPLTWDAAIEAAIVGDDTERLEMLYQQIVAQHGRLRPHVAAKLIEAATHVPTEQVWTDFLQVKYLHERRNIEEQLPSWWVLNAVLRRAVSDWDDVMAEKIIREAKTHMGIQRFGAMTYSLMLELYARQKNHLQFMRWCDKMADSQSMVTGFTTRALICHLHNLAHDEEGEVIGGSGREAMEELAEAVARLYAFSKFGRKQKKKDVDFSKWTSFKTPAELARKIMDVSEVRDNAIWMPSIEEYVTLCETADDLEDIFQRLDRHEEAFETHEITPEFVQAFFLAVTEIAPHLQPRLRDFLINCLETQPKESAQAALGVFCSISPPHEVLELFKTLIEESEDNDLEDDELVIFLASCAVEVEDADYEDNTPVAVDAERLYQTCQLVAEYDISLGASSITFLLRTLLSLSRRQEQQLYGGNASPQRVYETRELIKSLLSAALAGSSREEMREFIEEIASDPRDLEYADEILELL